MASRERIGTQTEGERVSEKTGISWTDHTFNPWWGCVKVSPACTHCYAETFSKRVGLKVWGAESERRFFGPKHWNEPLKWNAAAVKAGVRRRVFCASMADVFEDRDDLVQARADLFLTIEETPALDWLLLTKRPENIERLYPKWYTGRPWKNVWLGTTVESQQYANSRIPALLSVPAVVHFVSAEPLIGPVDLSSIRWETEGSGGPAFVDVCKGTFCTIGGHGLPGPRIDWVIVGGESGGHARPSHPDWFRSLRDQCQAAGVAFHFKQWGEWVDPSEISWAGYDDVVMSERGAKLPPDGRLMWHVGKKAAGRKLDGREWLDFPTVSL